MISKPLSNTTVYLLCNDKINVSVLPDHHQAVRVNKTGN